METSKPTQAQLVAAIKASVTSHTRAYASRTPTDDEQGFCQYNGAITRHIASTLGIDISATRHALDKLVKQGLVLKSRNNGGCMCRWWPVGHLQELQQGGGV